MGLRDAGKFNRVLIILSKTVGIGFNSSKKLNDIAKSGRIKFDVDFCILYKNKMCIVKCKLGEWIGCGVGGGGGLRGVRGCFCVSRMSWCDMSILVFWVLDQLSDMSRSIRAPAPQQTNRSLTFHFWLKTIVTCHPKRWKRCTLYVVFVSAILRGSRFMYSLVCIHILCKHIVLEFENNLWG
jgi:hypothetical protein